MRALVLLLALVVSAHAAEPKNKRKHSPTPSPTPSATATATPVPSPTSIALTVSWNPSPGATGYRVFVGTASGRYDFTPTGGQNVGNTISTRVNNLINGVTYFFAVKAYNKKSDGTEQDSPFSIEQSYPPTAGKHKKPVDKSKDRGVRINANP